MNEHGLWRALSRVVGPYGRLERIENPLKTGMADVIYLFRRYPKMSGTMG